MEWKSWFSGAVAGISMSVMGHPFDTLKTRMQADVTQRSALRCAVGLVQREGMFALWKGLYPAFIAGASPMFKY